MLIDFQFITKYGLYSDVLDLPDDNTFTDAEIQDMQIQRLNSWIACIETANAEQEGS